MSLAILEKTKSNLILIGAPLSTVFLVTQSVTDPVNAPKLAVTGVLAFALAGLFFFNPRVNISSRKVFFIASFFFIAFSVVAIIASPSPLAQNIYGVYGRNTGFIAYLALLLIALVASTLVESSSYKKLIFGLQIAGLVNIAYCTWVIVFGDFLSWNNPYGNILGLFGNPNFISAFLGIFITTTIAYAAGPERSWKYRIAAIGLSALAYFLIIDSNAIQGIVVTLGGLAIVGLFLIRSYFKSSIFTYLYILASGSAGVLAVLGALQKGPLTFIYKTSVSLRGEYWQAGAWMGSNNPLTGVGMDSYGDWYRRARSIEAATILPGPSTVTNAAHNVVLDFFSYGGWPLLFSYLGLLLVAGLSALKVIRRGKKYDPIFVAIFAGWVCYQVQSLISINQIGLAIWGWIFTGALVGYEISTREKNAQAPTKSAGKEAKAKTSSGVISPQLVAGIGGLIGLFIAIPPVAADNKWRTAITSNSGELVLAALEPGYLSPPDSFRYAQAVQLFANSNLMEQALQVALKGIAHNPEYFDAWRSLYFLPNATPEQKSLAVNNMKRLDPLNPDVTAR